ncbi:MAG: MATE family efflux transporter [Spirochaetales bacterium]|nr:MATE family efflux transporter [Spirochaetales bacterium]
MKNRKLTEGNLLLNILIFSLPLMLSGILQLLFNAADTIVVGQFAGKTSLAAVGSTTSLIHLLINLFIGLSVGANVVVAHFIGAEKNNEANDAMYSSIILSLLCGIILAIIGLFFSPFFLHLMGSPDDVIVLASKYMRIYFLGMPALMIYDFGSAILRAVGDTKHPLYYLCIAGVINIILNLLFVIIFHLGVVGVALATTISQCISAVLILIKLCKGTECLKFSFGKLVFNKSISLRMVKIGFPAGIGGVLFSLSNVVVQSAINSFGSVVIAGCSAAANVEGFLYASTNCFFHAGLTFAGQYIGAGKYKKVPQILLCCAGSAFIVCTILSGLVCIFRGTLASIYSTDPQVMEITVTRLLIVCSCYAFCSVMDVIPGVIRGMGYSVAPTLIAFTGACAFRILWVATIFQYFRTLTMLLIAYPISWIITISGHLIFFTFANRKLVRLCENNERQI